MKGKIFELEGDIFLCLSDPFEYDGFVFVVGITDCDTNLREVGIARLLAIRDFEKIHPLPEIFKNYMD